MAERFDLVVIGAGPTGEKGAAQAAWFGKRVAIVEKAPAPGGAGVHTGTLPSKTLRETALFLSGSQARSLYGLSVELTDKRASVATLIRRKAAMAAAEVDRMRENLDWHRVRYVRGQARFVDAHAVEVATPEGPRRLEADVFLVATGSSPRRPPEFPWGDIDMDDSDDVLELDQLPATLVVLGAGVIGCEYAAIFAALGAQVTLVEPRAEVLPFLDREVGARLLDGMRRLGVTIRTGIGWRGVVRGEGGLVTTLADGSTLVAEKVLLAAGRTANTAGLGLELVGVRTSERGAILVDAATYRTAAPHIYAAGDVIGFPALASVGMEQARVAMCHAFDARRYKPAVSPLLPYGIYTIPEASCVGLTEQACLQEGVPHVVGRCLHGELARGRIMGDLDGLTKLVVHAHSRKLLGVHVVGERASELVHTGHAVLQLGGTVDVFIDMVFNHPTQAEAYKYAAYDALEELARRSPTPPPLG
jgi:NAD(P) transhydrogenase